MQLDAMRTVGLAFLARDEAVIAAGPDEGVRAAGTAAARQALDAAGAVRERGLGHRRAALLAQSRDLPLDVLSKGPRSSGYSAHRDVYALLAGPDAATAYAAVLAAR